MNRCQHTASAAASHFGRGKSNGQKPGVPFDLAALFCRQRFRRARLDRTSSFSELLRNSSAFPAKFAI